MAQFEPPREEDLQQFDYPATFSVDYPDRDLDRLTTFFRLVLAIPILIVLGAVASAGASNVTLRPGMVTAAFTAGGLQVLAPLLMILFRRKYPRWWFDWNLELLRFVARIVVFLALMDDEYPSTDDLQSVDLDLLYPDASDELNRWLPLVKWLLAIPHYVVLVFLGIGAGVAVVCAWVSILLTGRYPEPLFHFVEGVMRWNVRVVAYATVLVTDEYPPFDLAA